MADNENVDTGSETSSDVAAETSQETTEATETTETADTSAQTAETEVAAEQTADTGSEVTEDASRTGFADKGLRAGDACVCPDGRTGTVHGFDAGLICIPNADQGN